jgi:hypothetical protein
MSPVNNNKTRSYYRKESAASPPRDQRQGSIRNLLNKGCLYDPAYILTVFKRRKRHPMRLGIRHLKRHQKRRVRVQHRLIQELNKIAKTFRIFLALQICFVR